MVTRRDPSAALAPSDADEAQAEDTSPGATIAAGMIRSLADVAAGLAGVADYFSRFEPSNPALLLVRQAEQLMGKSFLEVLRILAPAHVEQAAIQFGKDQKLELPLERLSAFAHVPPFPAEDWGSASSDEPTESETVEESSDSGAEPSSADGSGAIAPAATNQNGRGRAARLVVKSRRDAIAVLDQIGVYYRAAEPSSPVPFITERARGLAERDFIALLKDFLPEAAFKSADS
jgi:type VI secretion system protein ImpA